MEIEPITIDWKITNAYNKRLWGWNLKSCLQATFATEKELNAQMKITLIGNEEQMSAMAMTMRL